MVSHLIFDIIAAMTKNEMLYPEFLDLTVVCTSDTKELARNGIQFPRNVDGLLMLDVGAGTSIAQFELQERGAQIVAVDTRYAHAKKIKR